MRIDTLMRLRIVLLDMAEISGVLERRNFPIEQLQPFVDVRVVMPDHPNIALEVLDVNWIKTHNGGVQAYISLCEGGPDQKAMLGVLLLVTLKNLLNFIQMSKNVLYLLLINILTRGKPSFVDTIVNIIVN